jgi:hypothetical protein
MKWYNAEPVYGHGAGSNEPGYTRIVEPGKIGGSGLGNVPIYVPDEKLIDLRPYALTQSPAILASMSTIQGTGHTTNHFLHVNCNASVRPNILTFRVS